MAKKPRKPPFVEVNELALKLGEMLDRMEEETSATEAPLGGALAEGARYWIAQIRERAKRASQSTWSEVLEMAVHLKGHWDQMAEDTDVETGLWGDALTLTNRLIRMAKKELAGVDDQKGMKRANGAARPRP